MGYFRIAVVKIKALILLNVIPLTLSLQAIFHSKILWFQFKWPSLPVKIHIIGSLFHPLDLKKSC